MAHGEAGHDYDALRLAIARLARRARLERASGDVGDSQLSVLFVICREGPKTLRSLSERERVSAPSMSRTVDALVRAGLVTKMESPDDGRKLQVTPTLAGKELVHETKRRRAEWFEQAVRGLTESHRQTLLAAGPIMQMLAES